MLQVNCLTNLLYKIFIFLMFFITIIQDLPTLSLRFREAALPASPQSVCLNFCNARFTLQWASYPVDLEKTRPTPLSRVRSSKVKTKKQKIKL